MENQDYKYLIQDLTKMYVGAAYTYQELMDNEEVSFKLRSMIGKVMVKEVDGSTKISDHLFFIDKSSLTYMTLKHLKVKFKLNVFRKAANKGNGGYVNEIYTIDKIVDDEYLQQNKDTIFVEEMIISKLNLAALNL